MPNPCGSATRDSSEESEVWGLRGPGQEDEVQREEGAEGAQAVGPTGREGPCTEHPCPPGSVLPAGLWPAPSQNG